MFSILNKDKAVEYSDEIPVFLKDLNIDRIIGKIAEDWGEETSEMFLKLPEKRELEEYRREIFNEIKEEETEKLFKDFSERMRQRSICKERRKMVKDELQKQIWFVRETAFYVTALEKLNEALKEKDFSSEGIIKRNVWRMEPEPSR